MQSISLSSIWSSFKSGLREAMAWPCFAWLLVRLPVSVRRADGDTAVMDERGVPVQASGSLYRAVEMDRDDVLVVERALPGLTEASLASAIALEVERISPFGPEGTLWGWHVVERTERQLHVRFAMTSRDAVARRLAALGVSPEQVEVWAQTDPPLVLQGFAEGTRLAQQRRRTYGTLLLLTLLIVTVLALPAVPLLKERLRVFEAQAHHEQLARQAAPVLESREALARTQDAVARLQAVLQEEARALELIERLTLLLPDSVHVTNLEQQGAFVRLTGHGPGASVVVDRLGEVKDFQSFRSASAITRLDNEGNERFSVEFRFMPEGNGQ
ncbi:MAG: PilN domain-containing protein [Rhodocyclaceae bacterium]